VFIKRPKLFLDEKKPMSEIDLHKTVSLCLTGVSPKIAKCDLEAICLKAHGGLLRLFVSPPDAGDFYNWYETLYCVNLRFFIHYTVYIGK